MPHGISIVLQEYHVSIVNVQRKLATTRWRYNYYFCASTCENGTFKLSLYLVLFSPSCVNALLVWSAPSAVFRLDLQSSQTSARSCGCVRAHLPVRAAPEPLGNAAASGRAVAPAAAEPMSGPVWARPDERDTWWLKVRSLRSFHLKYT